MKFGELIRHSQPDLIISRRHDAWMEENSNPTYNSVALNHAHSEFVKQSVPRDRRGTYSASSLNSCARRQQFTFIGLPELPPSPKTAAIFQNGTFMHIRWQMAGLTEGWLKEAEVPLPENYLHLAGTMDGIAYEGSVVEFKSINSNGFGRVSTFGPKEDHIAQAGTYVAASGAERATFIYEDKNTQEYREFVVSRSEMPIKDIEARAEALWLDTEQKTLAEPLDKCLAGEGYQYTGCPFRDRCLKIKSWDHAEEMR